MKNLITVFALLLFVNIVNAQNLANVYDVLPDAQSCKPGVLKQADIDLVIQKVNQIRILHKLPPVDYEFATQAGSMEGSLNIVASGVSGHIDDPSSACYTPAGGAARMKSNLFAGQSSSPIYYNSADIIVGWLIDDSNSDKANEYKVGHRRAIINPFLKKFSFGRADGYTKAGDKYMVAANFHYQDYTTGTASTVPVDYIAYPYEDYPVEFFNKDFYLSFNVLADKNSLWNNQNVSFAGVQITMKDDKGNSVGVNSILSDNEGWGSYPNNVSWKAPGLQNDTKYLVEIKNVNVNGTIKEYSYWFRLTNIDHSKKPATPAQVSPLNASENIKINMAISWDAVQNAAYYKFQLADNPQFNNPKASVDKQFITGYNVSGLAYKTTYYWRVAAGNDAGVSDWSPTWSFTTSDSKPVDPTLQSPADLSVVNTNTPKLQWSEIASAESYLVQVSLDQGFTGFNVKYSKSVTTNYVDVPKGVLQVQTKYYWRVQSKNSEGNSDWSPVWSFNTGTALPLVETLYPADKATNVALAPKLEWKAVEGAKGYQLQLNFLNDFENGAIVNELNWKDNFYQISENILKGNTTYYWRVRAVNDNGTGDWNNVLSFTTEPETSVEILNSEIIVQHNNRNLYIEAPTEINEIRIFTYTGIQLYNTIPNTENVTIDLNSYASGVYFMTIRNNDKIKFVKLMIK